jgi:hypothetical protein
MPHFEMRSFTSSPLIGGSGSSGIGSACTFARPAGA